MTTTWKVIFSLTFDYTKFHGCLHSEFRDYALAKLAAAKLEAAGAEVKILKSTFEVDDRTG